MTMHKIRVANACAALVMCRSRFDLPSWYSSHKRASGCRYCHALLPVTPGLLKYPIKYEKKTCKEDPGATSLKTARNPCNSRQGVVQRRGCNGRLRQVIRLN